MKEVYRTKAFVVFAGAPDGGLKVETTDRRSMAWFGTRKSREPHVVLPPHLVPLKDEDEKVGLVFGIRYPAWELRPRLRPGR